MKLISSTEKYFFYWLFYYVFFFFAGWNYCPVCEANAPPRAFHCQTCNRCILKRDHHCMFTGKCIGYFNHRYYICLICYTWLGAMFASTYCMGFAWTILGEFSFYNLMCFCFPIFLFLFGMLDFYTAIICLLTLVSTLFWAIISFLIVWHSKHIIYNLTTHERRHNIFTYNLGCRENIRHIFGSKWYICWLFPWISSPLPGDGMSFPTSGNFENPKDQWPMLNSRKITIVCSVLAYNLLLHSLVNCLLIWLDQWYRLRKARIRIFVTRQNVLWNVFYIEFFWLFLVNSITVDNNSCLFGG